MALANPAVDKELQMEGAVIEADNGRGDHLMSRRLPRGRLVPSAHPIYPEPTSMARLNDLTWIIMDAAAEYDGLSDELTSAADFAAWLDLEVQRAEASPARTRHER